MVDCLESQRIKEMLKYSELCPTVLECASSTNTQLRELAEKGAPEGMLLITDYQTAGRGRHGRNFFSPKGTGLYMSLLLRPTFGLEQATLLTTACAVAAAEAVETLGISLGIKWVNDLFLNGRKVAGILVEAIQSGIIVGIGFNLYPPEGGFPSEISEIATAIFEKEEGGTKNRLAAEWANRFWNEYQNLSADSCLIRYRERSILNDSPIVIIQGEEQIPAIARGINDRFELIAELSDGKCLTLSSGEVRIRVGNN